MNDQVDVEEAKRWIRARPRCLWELMFHLPPSCRVRATRPLGCPRPGEVGAVMSYVEKKDGQHTVRVWAEGNPLQAECAPEWLEVVSYHGPLTPAFVARALGLFS